MLSFQSFWNLELLTWGCGSMNLNNALVSAQKTMDTIIGIIFRKPYYRVPPSARHLHIPTPPDKILEYVSSAPPLTVSSRRHREVR